MTEEPNRQRVFDLTVAGMSGAEIARELGISRQAVSQHRTELKEAGVLGLSVVFADHNGNTLGRYEVPIERQRLRATSVRRFTNREGIVVTLTLDEGDDDT